MRTKAGGGLGQGEKKARAVLGNNALEKGNARPNTGPGAGMHRKTKGGSLQANKKDQQETNRTAREPKWKDPEKNELEEMRPKELTPADSRRR